MNAAYILWDDNLNGNRIFDKNLNNGKENAHTLLKKAFREHGDDINTIDMYDDLKQVDLFLFTVIDPRWLNRVYKMGLEDRCVYCSGEPVVVIPDNCKEGYKRLESMFPYFLSVDLNAVDNVSVFFMTLPYHDAPNWGNVDFREKKLITNISGNKHSNHPYEIYSEREKVMSFFEKNYPNDIDCYGTGWNVSEHPSYRGTCVDKSETYHFHKFALSFENTINVPGYVTEKIMDCFYNGIVPIYWGAPNIADYIPKECFIDYSEFSSIEDMANYIKEVKEEDYNVYLSNIRKFIDNPESLKHFSSEELYSNIKFLYDHMNKKEYRVKKGIRYNMMLKSIKMILDNKVYSLKKRIKNK